MKNKIILDIKVIDQLKQLDRPGEDSVVANLIGIFIRNAPGHIKTMRDALYEENAVKLNKAAHSLKGNGAMFGAAFLTDLCRQLEQTSKKETHVFSDSEKLVKAIEEEFYQVKKSLIVIMDEVLEKK
jgi:two-component system, sensor histidine kinase and response regulator